VLAEPTIEARLADLGTVPMPLNAPEFAAFIAGESEKWGKVVAPATCSTTLSPVSSQTSKVVTFPFEQLCCGVLSLLGLAR